MAYRWAPSGAALLGFLVMAGLRMAGFRAAYQNVLWLWGVLAFPTPFLDFSNSLAAWDCTRLGFDVVQHNPCDILGRVYNYGPVWMAFAWIPLTQGDLSAVGVALDLGCIVALAALPPAGDGRELALRVVAAVSSTAAFAAERANVDELIFLLLIGMAFSMRGGWTMRRIGYGLALMAAAIKYYPAVVLALALRERPRRFAAVAAVCAAFGVWYLAVYGEAMAQGAKYIPDGVPNGDMFGARNLSFGWLMIGERLFGPTRAAVAAAACGTLGTALACGATGLRSWRSADWPAALAGLPALCSILLVEGSLLLGGCFFAGQSVAYRGIFLLFLLPGLAMLARDRNFAGARMAVTAAGAALLVMWTEAIRRCLMLLAYDTGLPDGVAQVAGWTGWILREAAWWFLVTLMVLVVGGFVARAPLLVRLSPRRARA